MYGAEVKLYKTDSCLTPSATEEIHHSGVLSLCGSHYRLLCAAKASPSRFDRFLLAFTANYKCQATYVLLINTKQIYGDLQHLSQLLQTASKQQTIPRPFIHSDLGNAFNVLVRLVVYKVKVCFPP